MKRELSLYLHDILESIALAESHKKKLTKREFLRNKTIQDAVILRLAVIGEAIKHVPDRFRDEYPHIQWRNITGMRNVVIHEYFAIDFDITWKTVKKDLPRLKRVIETMLDELKK